MHTCMRAHVGRGASHAQLQLDVTVAGCECLFRAHPSYEADIRESS